LQIAPEVLPVAVPVFVLQPLVENAVRHGLEAKPGPGQISIVAEDAGPVCRISVEDDGVGMEPQQARASLAGREEGIGLANVDERLRAVFGPDYGLLVETAPGAGTKVSLQIPKYRSGVRPT
ncbi:MAG: sensor histidine kinase, partial [Acidimicrobiia bacterium]